MADKYYQQGIEEVLKQLNSGAEDGLSQQDATKRLEEYGANRLNKGSQIAPWEIFVDQFKNIIIFLLIIASAVSFFLGDYLEGFAVLAVIIINALFGFLTEYRAEKSVEALKEMITTEAKVIREGKLQELDANDLVPGDIIILEEGDRITADGRLVETENLAVDEAMLTGESEPVNKKVDRISDEEVPLAEKKNMVFMGTAVTRGNGKVIVTGTGSQTEMGQISNLLSETEDEDTPLEEKLEEMGKSLIVVTLVIAAIVTGVGVITGRPIFEMVKTGIALAIAAVPEGLPAVATITLAIGMKKMAEHNALVKSLPAVETLGSTTVICTDKTGTLTENQMTVKEIYLNNKKVNLTGTGYQPEGEFKLEGEVINAKKDKILELFLKAGTLCSNAVVDEQDGLWNVVGDPTEGALVTAAKKADLDRRELEDNDYERIAEIPFTSEAKYMAVSYKTPKDNNLIFLKGAPDVVIEMCGFIQCKEEIKELDEEEIKRLKDTNHQMAEKGLRVLAVAYKNQLKESLEEEIKSNLVLLGFAGIMDPPRPDVKGAISQAHQAGIKTIMITGDHGDTAKAISQEIGISTKKAEAITGSRMDKFSLETLTEKIKDHSIFARVSPKNKLDIVDALNNNKEITAMTGDGVNDAPALKKADIGIAMGQRGTAVAKEAADMLLLDDKFSTIVEAVKQGRVIFDNIQKFVHYLFSCNLSEILFIFISILLKIKTPLLALQILWLNLVTDVFPALVLAWEAPEGEVMSNPPRDPETAILTSDFKFKIAWQGLVVTLGPLLVYLYALKGDFSLVESRTIGFVTLAFVQLFHVFNVRRKDGLGFDATLFKNIYLWGAIVLTIGVQLIAVYMPFMQRILNTAAVSFQMWMIILLGAILPVVFLQILAVIRKLRAGN